MTVHIDRDDHQAAVAEFRQDQECTSTTIGDPLYPRDFAEVMENEDGDKFLVLWEHRDDEYVRSGIYLTDDTIVALVQSLLK